MRSAVKRTVATDNSLENPEISLENSTLQISNEMRKIKPFTYRLRLMGDEEMLTKSEIIFGLDKLISANYTLDSSTFGCTNLHSECSTCGHNVDDCVGHMGAIVSPFPFVKVICLDNFKAIIRCLCPVCSNIPLDKSIIRSIMQVDKKYRLANVVTEIEKLRASATNGIICPFCNNKIVLMDIYSKEPLIYVSVSGGNQEAPIILNPLTVHSILQNFVQYDVIGFNKDYNVGNMMTRIIPIIPNKLRMKSIDNSVSIITSFYKNFVEEILPELNKIYKILSTNDLVYFSNRSIFEQFTSYYNKLMAYYYLITDSTSPKIANKCLEIANKNDRKHFESGVSCIGRMKEKHNTMFGKGIISARVDDSCRSVLGGAPDCKIMNVEVPNHIANKLTMKYPVFEENLRVCQQLLASMSEPEIFNNITVPHVLYVEDRRTKFRVKINTSNALAKAATIRPGDKLEISLINGTFVMHCRFPSMREESWTSQRVTRTNSDIIAIPLSICKMKTADFDGDESQIYVSSNTCFQLEALLLHSCTRMVSAYKDKGFAIWYSADAVYGVSKIQIGKRCVIRYFEYVEEYLVTDRINAFLPKTLNYKDANVEIIDGKIVGPANGKLNLNNMSLMYYMKDLFGSKVTLDVMDEVVQTAYDLNRNDGINLGFEIKVFDKDVNEKLRKIRNETYQKLLAVHKSNTKKELLEVFKIIEEPKMEVQEMLEKQSVGSEIANLGFLPKYLMEYSHTVNQLDYIKELDGSLFKNCLAENTRTLSTFHKYSIDPRAYGYVENGYAYDISPVAEFWQCKHDRIALVTKSGNAIAKSGYLQKRLSITYNSIYADFNHAACSNTKLVSLVYGLCGCDPRKTIYITIPYIKQSNAEANTEFKQHFGVNSSKDSQHSSAKQRSDAAISSKDSQHSSAKQLSNNVKRILQLYDEITAVNKIWACKTTDVESVVDYSKFATGFDFEQFINRNCRKIANSSANSSAKSTENSAEKSSKLTENRNENVDGKAAKATISAENQAENIEWFIKEMYNIVWPNAACYDIWANCYQRINFKNHELYFRIKFTEYELTKDFANKLLLYFNNMLCEGGESIGMKAANSISEPVSQLILHAIHGTISKGTDKNTVRRMTAFDSFETLFGGREPKEVVVTIGLYDDSYENSKKFAEQQETFYINDIWNKAEIIITNNVDERIVKMYEGKIDFTQFNINPMMMSVNLNLAKIAPYNIHITEIFNRLLKQYPKIMFIAGYVQNITEFNALVYFNNGTTYEEINFILEEWSLLRNDHTLIHGGYLTNCYVTENKNLTDFSYDFTENSANDVNDAANSVDSSATTATSATNATSATTTKQSGNNNNKKQRKHYVILANENTPGNGALENLIYDPAVDPYKCTSSNIETIFSLFGICEANARHIAECQYVCKNVSATSGILISHFKLVSDASFSTGIYLTADRYSLNKDDENDPLRLISYETPRDFLANTIMIDKTYSDNSLVSSTFFGCKGSTMNGDMISKIMLYETK